MENTDNKSYYTGLTSEEAGEMKKQGRVNKIPSKSSKTIPQIIASNVFTYFNAIFCFLAVLLIVTGSFRNLTFMVAVIANTLLGIIQQIRSKKVLDDLALLDVSRYTVIRDGKETEVNSDELVEGDLILLSSGQHIPADAVVIQGEAGVNESLLTGEADEISKTEGSELKSGSFLVFGKLRAKLVRVGAQSYAAQLTMKAKEVKEKQSDMIRDIEKIVKVAGIIIIPIGGVLVYQALWVNHLSLQEAFRSMVGAVVGMIPEGLYLLVTIALVLSAMRLAKDKVLFHDMKSIETLARVDVLCVDKTGTITSEEMKVTDLFSSKESDKDSSDSSKELFAKYVNTIEDSNMTMAAIKEYISGGGVFKNAKVTAFSSKLKYSQIISDGAVYRFGAPEFILDRQSLENNRDISQAHTSKGERVLVFAEKQGEVFTPLLFVSLKNSLRENAVETFDTFKKQGVAIKVISGDNPLTVSAVAKEAGIENADRYIDATVLDTDEKIRQAVSEYTIFGRVQPEQKKSIIKAFKKNGQKVAMTGDGVNDILAMKEADCSIAMGSGSDAARQAAQVVLLDSNFSRMLKIVAEGRRNINNITRSATLFLYKNIFSLLLALFSIISVFAYPLSPAQISMISLFNIGIPAFLLALEKNEKKQKGEFLKTTFMRSVPAALTSFFTVIALMFFGDLFSIQSSDISTAATYLLSVVGFLILIYITRPLNRYRTLVIALCIAGAVTGAVFLKPIFDISGISLKTGALCVVFAFAAMSLLLILLNAADILSGLKVKLKKNK